MVSNKLSTHPNVCWVCSWNICQVFATYQNLCMRWLRFFPTTNYTKVVVGWSSRTKQRSNRIELFRQSRQFFAENPATSGSTSHTHSLWPPYCNIYAICMCDWSAETFRRNFKLKIQHWANWLHTLIIIIMNNSSVHAHPHTHTRIHLMTLYVFAIGISFPMFNSRFSA